MSKTLWKRMAILGVVALGIAGTAHAEKLRFSGDGASADFAIEADGESAKLYLTKKPTNEPVMDAVVRLVPDEEGEKPVEFASTDEPGVFVAHVKSLPEGSLVMTIGGGAEEAVEVYPADSGDSGHGGHGHEHSHGGGAVKREIKLDVGKAAPIAGLLAVGLFLIGLFAGRFGSRKNKEKFNLEPQMVEASMASSAGETIKRVGGILLAIGLTSALAPEAKADEGHTHAAVEVDAGAGREIFVSKKSQLMVGVRTQPANVGMIAPTVLTYGHVTPHPQKSALVRAPMRGVLITDENVSVGQRVRKGQLLAKIDGMATIELRSPIDGIVTEAGGAKGSAVESGEQIFQVVDTSRLWIDAEVFQRDYFRLKQATKTLVHVEGMAQPLVGKITSAFSAIDGTSMVGKMFVEIDNPDRSVPLGALTRVEFVLDGQGMKGMSFPKNAVLNRGGETVVFVQTGPEAFEPRPVAVERLGSPTDIVVTKGLQEGDRVVVTGNYQMLVGAK